ncbi:MAG: sulfatase-like hydrolase/transferase [Clostridia bacterium]|nr:sulfatase-like hydrolase/transferase [Clostridia bacterium]
MNSLQGDNMGTDGSPVGARIFNLILWIVVVAVAITLACLKDKNGTLSTIGVIATIIVLATQIMTPLSIVLSNDQVFLPLAERLNGDEESSSHKIITYKNVTTASNNKNIYYFCIDRFDEIYAEHAYQQKPEIFDELTGFTWFQDNISVYAHTYPAIHNMLTLKDYDSSKSRYDNLKGAYSGNTPLNVLNDNDYNINLYSDAYYSFLDGSNLPDYIQNTALPSSSEVTSKLGLAFGMVQTALYRGMPDYLKMTINNVNSSTCNNFVLEKDQDGNTVFNTELDLVYNSIINKNFDTTEKNNFTFLHTSGCHNIGYSRDYNNIEPHSQTIVQTVEKNFEIINKYIKYLKQNNLYDSATIVITGDHSHPSNDYDPIVKGPRLTALFVKPANSSDAPLKTSHAQVSHDNIWATIMQSANISSANNYGTSVFDIPEGVNQERRYIWHTYSEDFAESKYTISGPGADFANWSLTETKTYNGRHITD